MTEMVFVASHSADKRSWSIYRLDFDGDEEPYFLLRLYAESAVRHEIKPDLPGAVGRCMEWMLGGVV